MSSTSDDEDEEQLVIVIDNGSSSCKAGFGDKKTLSCNTPTYVNSNDFGFDSVSSTMHGPIVKGVIQNFDDMEKIWEQIIYKQLNVKDPFSVLLSEHPSNTDENRRKIAEIMFEKFNAEKVCIAWQHELNLFSSGRSTGCVVDCGKEQTSVVCYYEMKPVKESFIQLDIGGSDLNHYLSKKYPISYECDLRCLRTHCHFSMDYDNELKCFLDGKYEPKVFNTRKGDSIEIGADAITCPEIMFRPSIIDKQCVGIQHAIYESISICENQEELFSHIMLVGGNTMLRNISERTTAELKKLTNSKVKVIAAPERLKSAWIGGAVMSQVEMFKDRFKTKDQYHESGP